MLACTVSRGAFSSTPGGRSSARSITHAHADHLCRGCGSYLVARDGVFVTRARLDESATVETIPYGETRRDQRCSGFASPGWSYPGLGTDQSRDQGEVWVVSGDYKTDPDRSCQPFEPIRCHVFVSECTFGLPVYRWPAPDDCIRRNSSGGGRPIALRAVRVCYMPMLWARLSACWPAWPSMVGAEQDLPGPIYTHGAVETMNRAYRDDGH